MVLLRWKFLIFLFVAFFVMMLYYSYKGVASLGFFSVEQIEIVGVQYSDASSFDELARGLLDQSLLSLNRNELQSSIEAITLSNPWISSVRLVRSLPNNIAIVVYEESPLFAVNSYDACYYVTRNSKRIPTQCSEAHIFMDSNVNQSLMDDFIKVYNANSFIHNAITTLQRRGISTNIDGVDYLLPYDEDILQNNYQVFTDNLSLAYSSINSVDLRFEGKILVKGTYHAQR